MEVRWDEKFNGHPSDWKVFKMKVIARAMELDEMRGGNCLDVIRYADTTFRLRGRKAKAGSKDEQFMIQFSKLKDPKKHRAQRLVYSFLTLSCADSCTHIINQIDAQENTCGSDLWIELLGEFEPRSIFNMIYLSVLGIPFMVVKLLILLIYLVFKVVSTFLGLVLVGFEILLDILHVFIELLHLLGIPRLRRLASPRDT